MNTNQPSRISTEQLREALTRQPDPERMAADLGSILAAVVRTRQRWWLPARLS